MYVWNSDHISNSMSCLSWLFPGASINDLQPLTSITTISYYITRLDQPAYICDSDITDGCRPWRHNGHAIRPSNQLDSAGSILHNTSGQGNTIYLPLFIDWLGHDLPQFQHNIKKYQNAHAMGIRYDHSWVMLCPKHKVKMFENCRCNMAFCIQRSNYII